MISQELERLKTAAVNCVAAIREIHLQRYQLDERAAQEYRRARHEGLSAKALKETIRALPRDTVPTPDQVWQTYVKEAGIHIDEAIADHDDAVSSALDAILGPVGGAS